MISIVTIATANEFRSFVSSNQINDATLSEFERMILEQNDPIDWHPQFDPSPEYTLPEIGFYNRLFERYKAEEHKLNLRKAKKVMASWKTQTLVGFLCKLQVMHTFSLEYPSFADYSWVSAEFPRAIKNEYRFFLIVIDRIPDTHPEISKTLQRDKSGIYPRMYSELIKLADENRLEEFISRSEDFEKLTTKDTLEGFAYSMLASDFSHLGLRIVRTRDFDYRSNFSLKPTREEIEEAKSLPNDFVYRNKGDISLGMWEVNEDGIIVGKFNPNLRLSIEKHNQSGDGP